MVVGSIQRDLNLFSVHPISINYLELKPTQVGAGWEFNETIIAFMSQKLSCDNEVGMFSLSVSHREIQTINLGDKILIETFS